MTDVHDLLAEPDPPHDWVVETYLDRGDRLILTGGEGSGKSTLFRQMGVQAASGFLPFTDEKIDHAPPRVLHIDLENSRRQSREHYRVLVDMVDLDRGCLYVVPHPEGIDLLRQADVMWLTSCVGEYQPDMLMVGPIYKMAGGNPIDEAPAKRVAGILDQLRVEHGFALMIEAHNPYGQQGFERPERPYGASLWSRWPEFGLHLAKGGDLRHYRPPREERDWPVKLTRGDDWPWVAVKDPSITLFVNIATYAIALGRQPSVREIEAHMDGPSKSAIQRAISKNRPAWDALFFHSPRSENGGVPLSHESVPNGGGTPVAPRQPYSEND